VSLYLFSHLAQLLEIQLIVDEDKHALEVGQLFIECLHVRVQSFLLFYSTIRSALFSGCPWLYHLYDRSSKVLSLTIRIVSRRRVISNRDHWPDGWSFRSSIFNHYSM